MAARFRIRRAHSVEAALLSELALRSKAHWGYQKDFLEACRAELTFTPETIADAPFFVAERDTIVGFYALSGVSKEVVDLTAIFVEPAVIGQGCGRRLFQHARDYARSAGFVRMTIQSDPNAEGFYRSMGAVRVGELESHSIPGRILPFLSLTVCADQRDMGIIPLSERL